MGDKIRPITNYLIELAEDGTIDKTLLIRDLLAWMSEADVREFADSNGWLENSEFEDTDNEKEEEEDEEEEVEDEDIG